jgi:hypothetical protein
MMIGASYFPYSSDIIISKIPLESMQSAEPGTKCQQSCLTANDFYKLLREKNVSFNYLFFLWLDLVKVCVLEKKGN